MQAVWIIAIVVGVIVTCGWCNFEMWKNRRKTALIDARKANYKAERDAERAAEKKRYMASFLQMHGEAAFIDIYGEAEYRKMLTEEIFVKGIEGEQQNAGAHGVAMQFHLAAMPQNAIPQYVTVVTQP